MINEASAKVIIPILKKFGLNDNGIAGLLGNLQAESALIPNNLQNAYNTKLHMTDEQYTSAVDNGTYTNFAGDKAGYGLAQWTSSGRKQGLLNYAKQNHKSIGDLEMQVNYLFIELSNSYKLVLKELTNPHNSVDSCARIVMLKFERPRNQSEANQLKRVAAAQEYYNFFFNKHPQGNTIPTVKPSSIMSISRENMTGEDLAKIAVEIATKYKTLYVLGCFGAPLNDKNKKRYTSNNTFNAGRAAMINAASADTFGFDCVCLIKGILWGWNGDVTRTYGGAGYKTNGVPDWGANTTIRNCKNVSTDFKNIKIGEALWMDGHIGIYIGNGLGVECTPKWQNKVQITAVGNIGPKAGYDTRTWTKHGELPWVRYTTGSGTVVPSQNEAVPSFGEIKYTVVRGDNLTKISKRYCTTVDSIVKLNNIANKNLISVGQVLTVRVNVPVLHVSTNGQTLRIREKADLNSTVLGVLQNNSPVNILNKENENWYKVEFNGIVGYCSAEYIK